MDIKYIEKLHELHNDLPFLPVEKRQAKLHDKTEYVIHIRTRKFKTGIKSWISFEKTSSSD